MTLGQLWGVLPLRHLAAYIPASRDLATWQLCCLDSSALGNPATWQLRNARATYLAVNPIRTNCFEILRFTLQHT